MRTAFVAAAVGVLCLGAATMGQAPKADGPRVLLDVTGYQSGKYLLTIEGSAVTIEAATVIDPYSPDPDVPVPPQPEPDSDFVKVVVGAVQAIPESDARHAAALKLAKTYEMLAGQDIPVDKVVNAVETIAKLALQADAKAWEGVRKVVETRLGQCQTEADCDKILAEATEAIESTIPASELDPAAAAESYGFDWDTFLDFLMKLLTMLLPLII